MLILKSTLKDVRYSKNLTQNKENCNLIQKI